MLASAVVAAAGDLRRQRRRARGRIAARLGLVGIAAAQLALALPELGGHVHAGNEAASWAVAAAVGLLTAAASPRRVLGILPVLSAAALVLVLTTVHDLADGDVHVEHGLPTPARPRERLSLTGAPVTAGTGDGARPIAFP